MSHTDIADGTPRSLPRIGMRDAAGYLAGRASSIRALGHSRSTLWVGFLFVISAGFAREYDGEDLLAEPWHLLIPLVASIGSSLLLFLLVLAAARRNEMTAGTPGSLYRQFLGLYWMTAPLAWVYAVPFERLLSGPDAVRANLWLLGLVATWRVLLMTRVICVMYGASGPSAFVLVMAFGDVLLFGLMQTVDLPLLQIMGGVRLAEADRILVNVATTLIGLSVLSAPVWLSGALVVLFRKGGTWRLAVDQQTPRTGVSTGLKAVVAASLIIWFAVLPSTQPEQQLRTQVERLIDDGKYAEAIGLMETAGLASFPPHWTPPPHVTREGIDVKTLIEMLAATDRADASEWIREIYWQRLDDALGYGYHFRFWWDRAEPETRLELVDLLETHQTGRTVTLLEELDRPYPSRSDDSSEDEAERLLNARLEALFDSAEK